MNEKLALYPYRAGHRQEEILEPLLREPEVVLSPDQLQEVLGFEQIITKAGLPDFSYTVTADYLQQHSDKTGERLPGIEEVWAVKINTATFGLNFFSTKGGQEAFERVFGTPLNVVSTDEVAQALLNIDIKAADSKKVSDLGSDSIEYEEKRLVDAFEQTEFKDVTNLPEFKILPVTKNPEDLVEKAKQARLLKGYYKALQQDLRADDTDAANPVHLGKQLLLRFHRERLNQLIASLYTDAHSLLYQYRQWPEAKTAYHLNELGHYLPSLSVHGKDSRIARNSQRIDWYRYGVAVEQDEHGRISYIGSLSPEAVRKANEHPEEERTIERGNLADIDPTMLSGVELNADTRVGWARKLLLTKGVLSIYEDYDPDRPGPAPDNKWQAIARKEFKVHSVDPRQKVSKIPLDLRNTSLIRVLPIMAHENFGHVVQHVRKEQLGIALAKKVGIDEEVGHHEAGAKALEKRTREVLTGQMDADVPGISYLRAIEERLRGGSFAESMKAYFDDFSRRYPDRTQREVAEIAVNRTRRIFRSGGQFVHNTNYLSNSKALAYLEGELVVEALPESLRYLLLVGGINLGKLALLHANGLIDTNQFKHEQQTALDILESDIRQKLTASS